MNAPHPAPAARTPRRRSILECVRGAGLVLGFTVALGANPAFAQEHKHKVPGLDKISGGSNQQAFSGKVQSLDMGRHLLNVNTVQGGVTEIFPMTKKVRVSTADGDKIKLEALKPGTNVLIYYDQKGDKRTVKQIIVLAAEGGAEKKPSPRS